MADALVRPAATADAALVADLQLQVWQQAYAEILPASILLADPAQQADRWQARIVGGGVFVAFEGVHPVGLAAVSADLIDGLGEIELLHVLPRWARRGHGGRLLATATTALRSAGAARGQWWIPETDRAVERFLLGAGWLPDGTARRFDTGETVLTELRYTGSTDLVLV